MLQRVLQINGKAQNQEERAEPMVANAVTILRSKRPVCDVDAQQVSILTKIGAGVPSLKLRAVAPSRREIRLVNMALDCFYFNGCFEELFNIGDYSILR